MAPPRRSPKSQIPKEDANLAEAAKGKAGGVAPLARMFRVTPQAASEWGRTRPIPRHVRPRLEEYLGLRGGDRAEPVESLDELLRGHRELGEHIRELLQPDRVADVEKLPPRYRERYRERVKEIRSRINNEMGVKLSEIAATVERELTDFRARLVAEFRAQRRGST